MSVLLEALKKAAEEKNKNAKQPEMEKAEASVPESKSTDSDVIAESPITQERLDTSLKMLDPAEEAKTSGLDLDEMIDKSSPSGSTLTPYQIPSTAKAVEDDLSLEKREQQAVSSKLKFSLPSEENAKENSENIPTSRTAERELPSVPNAVNQFDNLEAHPSGSGASDSADGKAVGVESINRRDVSNQFDENSDVKAALDESSQDKSETVGNSYEWSLDQLPAYIPEGGLDEKTPFRDGRNKVNATESNSAIDESELAKNSVLTQNAHAKPYSGKKAIITNPKIALGFGSLTVFMLIFGYSAYYYQQENVRLEASFEKYKIDPIRVELPTQKRIEEEVKIADGVVESPASAMQNMTEPRKSEDDMDVESTVSKVELPVATSEGVNTIQNVSKTSVNSRTATQKTTSSPNKLNKADESKSTIQPLKTNENVLVFETSVSTVLQPKPDALKTRIRKSKALSSTQRILVEGYQHYQKRDWPAAKKSFNNVIEKEPSNLKAMLGLAASQNNLGERPKAIKTYQKVLKINPGNTYALGALAEIANSVSAPNKDWIQQLSELTFKYPNSAVLQNALGNAFAKKANWFKAQQNYFNAVAIKPTEPKYLMNLAVSLDHLGKLKSAEEYYTKVLVYAENDQTLDQESIRQRLLVLRNFRNLEP